MPSVSAHLYHQSRANYVTIWLPIRYYSVTFTVLLGYLNRKICLIFISLRRLNICFKHVYIKHVVMLFAKRYQTSDLLAILYYS